MMEAAEAQELKKGRVVGVQGPLVLHEPLQDLDAFLEHLQARHLLPGPRLLPQLHRPLLG